MKRIFIFVAAVFAFFPVLSLGETKTSSGSAACQVELSGLKERRDRECGRSRSGDDCIRLRGQVNTKQGDCQKQSALEAGERRVKDAKAAVDKQNKKTDMMSMISTAVGGALIYKGFACCKGGGSCCWGEIAMGMAGVAMGQILKGNSDKLSATSAGLQDDVNTCVGGHCPPTAPGAPADTPAPPGLSGSSLLSGGPTLPDFTNCKPSCPCPPGGEALQNCKVTEDENGAPKLTYGPDKDKDGFGDEEITAADAAKVNQNDPKIKAAVAAAKAPYAALLAELENDEEGGSGEEYLADEDSAPAEEGFLSGGATRAGRSAAGPSAGPRRRKPTMDDDMKAVQGLMAQFMQKKKKKKPALKGEAKLLGKSQIGVARDNIFLMVHRRYQERRGENEFIEQTGAALSQNLF